MARPRKEINRKHFENLCGIQCSQEEICQFFEVTDKTLNSWCKREYGKGFSEVFKAKRGIGKISLRRTQWKLAEKSPAMAIFLGKNYLGQRDSIEHTNSEALEKLDAILKAARENAEKSIELEYITENDIQQETERIHPEGEQPMES